MKNIFKKMKDKYDSLENAYDDLLTEMNELHISIKKKMNNMRVANNIKINVDRSARKYQFKPIVFKYSLALNYFLLTKKTIEAVLANDENKKKIIDKINKYLKQRYKKRVKIENTLDISSNITKYILNMLDRCKQFRLDLPNYKFIFDFIIIKSGEDTNNYFEIFTSPEPFITLLKYLVSCGEFDKKKLGSFKEYLNINGGRKIIDIFKILKKILDVNQFETFMKFYKINKHSIKDRKDKAKKPNTIKLTKNIKLSNIKFNKIFWDLTEKTEAIYYPDLINLSDVDGIPTYTDPNYGVVNITKMIKNMKSKINKLMDETDNDDTESIITYVNDEEKTNNEVDEVDEINEENTEVDEEEIHEETDENNNI